MREFMPKGLSPIGLFRLCLEYRAKKTRSLNAPHCGRASGAEA
jgi:hypothetical protein